MRCASPILRVGWAVNYITTSAIYRLAFRDSLHYRKV